MLVSCPVTVVGQPRNKQTLHVLYGLLVNSCRLCSSEAKRRTRRRIPSVSLPLKRPCLFPLPTPIWKSRLTWEPCPSDSKLLLSHLPRFIMQRQGAEKKKAQKPRRKRPPGFAASPTTPRSCIAGSDQMPFCSALFIKDLSDEPYSWGAED